MNNTDKYCPILSKNAQYCPILPNIVKYYEIFSNSYKYCPILSCIAQYCSSDYFSSLLSEIWYCKEHSDIVQYCQIYPNIVKQKNSFYKSCSVRFTTWKCGIKSESLAAIWSQSIHFIKEHLDIVQYCQIYPNIAKQKNSFQKLFSLVYYLKMWHKKWKFSWHLVTKQSFCHFFN